MSCNRNDCAFKGTNTDTCDYILVTGKGQTYFINRFLAAG